MAFRIEFYGSGVDAVPKACGLGAIVEDVPEMAAAVGAGNLGPDHEEAAI